jgi:YD repeat-containing protein
VSVDGVTTGFTYDAAGRLATRTDTVDGKSFTSQFGYDANDNLQTITYPSGRQVGYEYDTQNRLTRVFNAATQGTYANAFSYHPSGAVTGYTAGNGVATWLTYHPTRQWLDTIMVGQNADRTQLTYAYDDVGNISSIADWREGYSQTFGYDALDRLTSASGIYGSLTYTYDAHGNRQTANGGTYSYDPGNLFRLQSINGSYNLQYDANGNLRGGFPGQYDYTPDNLLSVSTISGGATTRFTYDSDAWRLKKSIDGGTTYYYVRGPNGQLLSEWVNSSPAAAVKDYLYAGGRLIGVATTTAAPK